MGLKQKDILARFALTTGEYEDMEKSLVKYLEQKNLDARDRHRASLVLEATRRILGNLERIDEYIRSWWDLTEDTTTKPGPRREGDRGTWSHCGNGKPHAPHKHTVVMNEGPTPDVQCNGASA